MDKGKDINLEDPFAETESPVERAPRARNRTVVLSAEITNQVRARLPQEKAPPSAVEASISHQQKREPVLEESVRARPAVSAEAEAPIRNSAMATPVTPDIVEAVREIDAERPRSAATHQQASETPVSRREGGAPPARKGVAMRAPAPGARNVVGRERGVSPVGVRPPAPSRVEPQPPSEQTRSARELVSGLDYAASAEGSDVVHSQAIVWVPKTRLVGFLVSFDRSPTGEAFELRSGRFSVSSKATGQPNTLVIEDDTVSDAHAVVRVSPRGEIQVLDNLSQHGTRIKRFGSGEPLEISGEKASLEDGDVVSFGSRSFEICLIKGSAGAED